MSEQPLEIDEAELRRVVQEIKAAGKIGRARHEELMRAVDILQRRAMTAEGDIALALLEAAQEILGVRKLPT
jgi:hypothetical protein